MRVIVLGASTNRAKYGNIAVRAYKGSDHEVFPVNPRADEIEGLPCYHDLRDVPGPVDRLTIYLPPKLIFRELDKIAERGDVKEVWFNPGTDKPEVVDKARELGLTPVIGCSIVAVGFNPHA